MNESHPPLPPEHPRPAAPGGAPRAATDAAPGASSDAARGAHAVPMAFFIVVLAVLLVIAVGSLFIPVTPVEGLPADPSARAARDILWDRVMPATGGLRFRSAFLGELGARSPARPPDRGRIARARELLERSRAAHPFEPRVVAALGHLELARRRADRAETYYRRAIDLRAHCSEARLGLGVALALEAETTTDALLRRGLELRALAQFAAIGPRSECALDALYDRIEMLERVGRHAEARACAHEYRSRDSTSAWAGKLQEDLSAAK
ncbi:MAG: hypothetical protein HYR73_06415 [Candidatus Eisenbacteria bacterium]|nr:hypothetical protein [Candidatus Eisenbacteria bacterium]